MKWITINDIGELSIEEELVVGIERVLFVTVDKDGHRYLVMTYDSAMCDYVLTRVSNATLVDMLENRITLEQAFRNQEKIFETYIDENAVKYRDFDSIEFPANRLPDVGEYYELDYPYIRDYIALLKSENEQMKLSRDAAYDGYRRIQVKPEIQTVPGFYQDEIKSAYQVNITICPIETVYDSEKQTEYDIDKKNGTLGCLAA